MATRVCLGVLAALFLVSAAVGTRDAPGALGVRVLAAGEGGEGTKSGQVGSQKAGSQSPPPPPHDGTRPSSSSELEAQKQRPAGPHAGNSPLPSGVPSNTASASRSPSTSSGASDNAPPKTPVLPHPAPKSDSSPVPVPSTPSHPPPPSGRPSNLPPPSGIPLNPPPPSGSPSHPSPASPGPSRPSSPPPVPGNHPTPAEGRVPKSEPSEQGKESPSNGKDGKDKEKEKNSGSSPGLGDSRGKAQEDDKCNASLPLSCHVEGLVACLQHPQNGSQEWFLLVRNEEENLLNVNISASASMKIANPLPMPKHNIKKIKFHADAAGDGRIVLNAGKKDCILHVPPPSTLAGKFFPQFSRYANHVTPVYGIYVASLTVFFAGGTWACCKFRKRGRRVDAGVAYQQLEMGTHNQSSARADDNEMDGWDEGWNDDEWDEEEAVPRPPEKRGVSENGVTSKSSAKNDWEDWDD
uniref:DUF7356 domain-containing protein n=1 Tax=Anthurium amnicola TaxID=1678845 RepID=A0A1D1YI02_9ARAE